ncbi:MAG: signal peptidase II [Lachnospiraceae bacterium]|nr:signal peptidase II [Lachnospiraceae bacterium]
MENKTDFGRYIRALACFIVLVALDLLTKTRAAETLPERPIVLIKGVFELRYLENRGAAFGLLQNQRTFFLILTSIFILVMIWVFTRIPAEKKYLPLRILTVVVSAGAFGNFYDRLTLTYVRDFLYFSLINFPIFNVADIYVTCSAFAFFILIVFYYKEEDLSFFRL